MASPSDLPLNKTVCGPSLMVSLSSRTVLSNTERKTNYMQTVVCCGNKTKKQLTVATAGKVQWGSMSSSNNKKKICKASSDG